jgi:hypothetical protein
LRLTYEEKRKRKLESQRRYREKNREKLRKYNREYRKRNKDKVREYHKKKYNENIEHSREVSRRYYKNNKDKRKQYYIKNKDIIKEKKHKHYLNNREDTPKNIIMWLNVNGLPERTKDDNLKTKCRSSMYKIRDMVLKRDGHKCQICGNKNNLEIHENKYELPQKESNLSTLGISCHRAIHRVYINEDIENDF